MIEDGCWIENTIKVEFHAPHRFPPYSPFGSGRTLTLIASPRSRRSWRSSQTAGRYRMDAAGGRELRNHTSVTPGSGGFEAPRFCCAGTSAPAGRLSRLLLFDLLVVVAARLADRDPARLHRFRDVPHQLDLQQTVLECRAL